MDGQRYALSVWHELAEAIARDESPPKGKDFPVTKLAKAVDRIDNDGNYEPGNCRWATRSEQQKNKRKKVV